MDWGMLGAIFAMFSIFSGLMMWFMTRIENRLDAHISETSHHFDAINARIDTTQGIIMRMLIDKGK